MVLISDDLGAGLRRAWCQSPMTSMLHTTRGMVSMANNGLDTNGSQFFITYAKQPHLDMKYTVFGRVIDGFETLDSLEKVPVNEKTYKPETDIRIRGVTIHANPLAG
ncbi:peptidyl-prolyl cis-trans isomerase-like 3 [Babylonia areolata]|uniref:peptidyl-prolyl cis-trans isomerase-like 3 n=1 Tax=Babylonia areolata TaxID=304850 RepID=UPI003FD034A4